MSGEFLQCIDESLCKDDPNWRVILAKLPPNYSCIEELLIYYIEEKLIVSAKPGEIEQARRIYECVNETNEEAYRKFEDENWDYLAAIDFMLKGFSNWSNKPAFTI